MSGSNLRDNGNKHTKMFKNDFWSIYRKEESDTISEKSGRSNDEVRCRKLPPIEENFLKRIKKLNHQEITTNGSSNEKGNTKYHNIEKIKRNEISIDDAGDSKIQDNKNFNNKIETTETLKANKIENNFIKTNTTFNENQTKTKKKFPHIFIDKSPSHIVPINIDYQNTLKKEITINTNDLESEDDFKTENNEEVQKLLDFMNNLDFEKYLKDLHIREALHLIKNKIEKQNELEELQKASSDVVKTNDEIINNKVFQTLDEDTVKTPSLNGNFENNSKLSLPVLVHEKLWDNSIKLNNKDQSKNKEEKIKSEIAEKILQSEKKFRNVHSIQSVKKLLEREGITSEVKINPLKISILQERAKIKDYQHISIMLPNLRDLPLI